MPGPCPYALATAKVPSRRWRTRAELLLILDGVRRQIVEGRGASLDSLALEAGVSPYHLQRLFTAAYGESPKALHGRLRAEKAAELLKAGAKPIEVMVSLRYTELSAFSRDFKRHHGQSPRAFCKNCQPAGEAGAEHSKPK